MTGPRPALTSRAPSRSRPSRRASTRPRVCSVSGSRTTTTSARGRSASRSESPCTPSRAERATRSTSAPKGSSRRSTAAPIDPWPRIRTVAPRGPARPGPRPLLLAAVRRATRPAPCGRRGSRPGPIRRPARRQPAGVAQRHPVGDEGQQPVHPRGCRTAPRAARACAAAPRPARRASAPWTKRNCGRSRSPCEAASASRVSTTTPSPRSSRIAPLRAGAGTQATSIARRRLPAGRDAVGVEDRVDVAQAR